MPYPSVLRVSPTPAICTRSARLKQSGIFQDSIALLGPPWMALKPLQTTPHGLEVSAPWTASAARLVTKLCCTGNAPRACKPGPRTCGSGSILVDAARFIVSPLLHQQLAQRHIHPAIRAIHCQTPAAVQLASHCNIQSISIKFNPFGKNTIACILLWYEHRVSGRQMMIRTFSA